MSLARLAPATTDVPDAAGDADRLAARLSLLSETLVRPKPMYASHKQDHTLGEGDVTLALEDHEDSMKSVLIGQDGDTEIVLVHGMHCKGQLTFLFLFLMISSQSV